MGLVSDVAPSVQCGIVCFNALAGDPTADTNMTSPFTVEAGVESNRYSPRCMTLQVDGFWGARNPLLQIAFINGFMTETCAHVESPILRAAGPGGGYSLHRYWIEAELNGTRAMNTGC